MTTKAKVETPDNMDQRFVVGTTVTLEDCEVRYAHMIEADTMYGEEWNVQCRIEPQAAAQMKALGFNIKEDTGNGTFWLKAKRVVRTRAGKTQTPPVITLESDSSPVIVELGDGSTANVHLWCKYTAPIQGKVHMGCYLNGASVITLKPKVTESAVKF